MAAYNVEKYIDAAINSVISQTFKDWELIIIDDASSDKTPLILNKYSVYKNIIVDNLEKNLGNPFLVREKALQYASSRYIVMMDADDLLSEDVLQKHFEIIENKKVDMVQPQMWRKTFNDCFKILPKNGIKENHIYKGKTLVKLSLDGWKIPVAGYAIKKEIFKQACELTHQYNYTSIYADELMARYLLILSTTIVFSSAHYIYRLNEDSITHKENLKIKSGFITNQAIVCFCERNFGRASKEFKLAQKQELLFILHVIRILNKSQIELDNKKEIIGEINKIKNIYKGSEVKRELSFPYRIAIDSPLLLSRIFLLPLLYFLRKLKSKK